MIAARRSLDEFLQALLDLAEQGRLGWRCDWFARNSRLGHSSVRRRNGRMRSVRYRYDRDALGNDGAGRCRLFTAAFSAVSTTTAPTTWLALGGNAFNSRCNRFRCN